MAEHSLWERAVARSSRVIPTLEDVMKQDKLPEIISVIAIVIFLVFVFTISRPKEQIQGLEGGNIQQSIETNQYN